MCDAVVVTSRCPRWCAHACQREGLEDRLNTFEMNGPRVWDFAVNTVPIIVVCVTNTLLFGPCNGIVHSIVPDALHQLIELTGDQTAACGSEAVRVLRDHCRSCNRRAAKSQNSIHQLC